METVNARIRDLADLTHDGGGERDLQIALPDSNQGTSLEEHLLAARFLAITPFIRAAAPHALHEFQHLIVGVAAHVLAGEDRFAVDGLFDEGAG